MKSKLYIGILSSLFVILIMLNAHAAIGPGGWMNQATLSTVDSLPSLDPESSGFGTQQVVVWEEWNGVDWDIYMKSSAFDGAPGTWGFPPLHPATTAADEINPAVTVTNANIAGALEVHVVYQRWNAFAMQWDICHTYSTNFGAAWTVPVIMNANDARDPAIVYTEEISNMGVVPPPPWYGMCVQIVWSEYNPVSLNYEIRYNAWYYDPVAVPPVWAYVTVPTASTLIRASPGGNCEKPEIASVDETMTVGAWEYYFAIVWEEPSTIAPFNWEIWYVDGWTNIRPAPVVVVLPMGSLGKVSFNAPGSGDCYDADIAATQDYQLPAIALEEFYFHINWVFRSAPPMTYQIDTCFFAGPVPFPGAPVYIATAPAKGPVVSVLDRPTIANKLITRIPVGGSTIFETWMCWEDNTIAGSPPDIWYRVGQYNNVAPPFVFIMVSALVPYVQPAGSTDYNPELWNRNDAARLFPPFTHLVFDMTRGGTQEVEYIDP